MQDPLIELATVPPIPLDPTVLAARAPLARAVADLLAIPDVALDRPWRWRPGDPDDVELRYGLYRIHERLEAAIGAIEAGRSVSPGQSIGPAVPALAAMAAARWDLKGVLTPLDVTTWDADPGGGEWTVRRTVGHIIGGQRSYGWYNAWYLEEGIVDHDVERPPDSVMPPEPTEDEEAAGPPTEVIARLDGIVDANAVATAALPEAAMHVRARWAGLPVTIDFRLGRYGSHIREHTVQVDKTLAMVGRAPTETERLVRLILATYGRLEGLFVGRPEDELDRPIRGTASAVVILGSAIADAEATAADARSAVGR